MRVGLSVLLGLSIGSAHSWSCAPEELGCFTDFLQINTLAGLGPVIPSDGTSVDTCVDLCARIGFPLAGVEDHDQCFCGDEISAAATPVDSAECLVMNCSGNEEEFCGNKDRIRIFNATCSGYPMPNYWGCADALAMGLPYCNSTLSHEERLADLQNRMSLEEKIAAISPQPELGGTCNVHSGGVNRLGLPSYMWLVETNTAVASACLHQDKCASEVLHAVASACLHHLTLCLLFCRHTQFSGPLSLGASFNRTSWRLKGEVGTPSVPLLARPAGCL